MKKPLANVAASVRDRLLARMKAQGRPFDELLQYYATAVLRHGDRR